MRTQFKGEELEEEVKTAREAALQDLIDRQLIVQAFQKEKFELPDYFVEQRINDIIRDEFRRRPQTRLSRPCRRRIIR